MIAAARLDAARAAIASARLRPLSGRVVELRGPLVRARLSGVV